LVRLNTQIDQDGLVVFAPCFAVVAFMIRGLGDGEVLAGISLHD
jgi:hypothetical protein